MIPVVILPTINARPDLTRRMLQSIDHPVDRLVIVDNSLAGYEIDTDGPWQSVHYIRPILGLGNHGGINAGVSQTPEAPWWFFVSDDLAFGPGDLDAIVDMIESSDEPAVITGSWDPPKMLAFCYGAINRATVERVGLLDEWTFYPIFFGDNDYYRRCRLAGVEWIVYDGDIRHGERDTTSATLEASAYYRARNNVTSAMNRDAYIRKWGGVPGAEQFGSPWNLPVPLDFTHIDFQARAERKW